MTAQGIRQLLSEEELARFTRKSDWRGAGIVAFDWALVLGCLALAALYPNPLVYLLAVVLLGGRMMAFGVIVHEAGHRSLFATPWLNRLAGTWLSGYWVFSDMDAYMQGHLKHHQDCGSQADPDLKNYLAYPVSKASFRRKILRDLTGQIGWRRVKSIGRQIRRIRDLKPGLRRTLLRSLAVNLAMLGTLAALGHAEVYLLWVLAFMTTHMLVTRLRQVSEHAAVPDHFHMDARLNTRTLYLNRLERLLISPHNLSYHLEHHLMPSVPIYRLRALHEALLAKGHYAGVDFPRGYAQLLRRVVAA